MTVLAYPLRGKESVDLFDRGLSEDARETRTLSQRDDSPASIMDHKQLLAFEKLIIAIREAQTEGWDGYDALPADPNAVKYAIAFLQNLPDDLPIPEFAIDPDGDVAIEWDYGPRLLISIRIARDGTLYYAGKDGHASFHGVEPYREGIPEAVSRGIERVAKTPRE